MLQPRDLELLLVVDRFGLALRGQLQELFFGSVSRCNARLKLLSEWGFLAKVQAPFPLEMGGGAGAQALYACGKASLPLLAEHQGTSLQDVRARHRRVSPTYLLHTMEEVNFFVAVYRDLLSLPEITLVKFLGEWESRHDYEIRDPTQTHWQRAVYKPDSLLILAGHSRKAGYAVEIDRGHTSSAEFAHKIHLHETYRNLGLFEQRYGVVQEKTLVITTTPSRREHLRRLAKEERSNLFWTTTFEEVKSGGVFGAIWRAPESAILLRLPLVEERERK